MNETIYIYGLYDPFGRCRYVGQTNNPKRRANQLARTMPHNRPFILTVFRPCTINQATILEKQVILAFWRRNLCDWNKNLTGQSPLYRLSLRSRKIGTLKRRLPATHSKLNFMGPFPKYLLTYTRNSSTLSQTPL